jgi:predicted alpha/beta-hydrolase family hydrolase
MEPLLVDRSSACKARLVFAHGAGAAMDTPFMTRVATGLAAHGIEVVRFEFPYMQRRRSEGKRGAPDRMPILEAAFRAVIERVRNGTPLFLAGKSMGGRVATQIADAAAVRGVVALGYPFHPPKRPQALRVAHLSTLRTPCLIVQGTRDPLGTPEDVAGYALSASIRIHWLPDGDHSFEPPKSSGRSAAQHLAEAIEATASFVLARASA